MRLKRLKKSRSWKQRLQFWRHPKTFPWKRLVFGGGVFMAVVISLYMTFVLPDVRDADQLSFAESTIIYARGALDPGVNPNEHILYTIHGDENREYIPLEDISPWVRKATLAIEDDQFYSHFGFDIGGIVKGAFNHFTGIGSARGGSTITQQLVKNTFLNSDRSLVRKFNELLLSIKLEFRYSKDEILELYLNKIPYGNNAYGIEAAAKTYFNKSARDLTIAEASILASLPVAPTRFNPFGSNRDLLMGFYEMENVFSTEEEARAAEADKEEGNQVRVYKKGRKDLVLQRMLDLKMISQNQFQQAWAEALSVEFKSARTDITAPHFVFYVRERVEEKYGKEFLNQGGLRIYTSLDIDLQKEADSIIATKTAHYTDTYGAKNVALTAIKNGTGEILAYVGGKDFFDEKNDGQVDVLTSKRQPGSSFKPHVYAAGFAEGYAPGSVVFDVETDFGNNYKPQNFNEEFAGPVTFRSALNASLNIPAIKMAFLAGPAEVLELAAAIGVKYDGTADTHGVAIGVGVAEVEPLSHINSFQAFAGDGSWYEPTAILEIRNANDQVLEKVNIEKRKQDGIDPEVAALVRSVLTDQSSRPVTDGFAWNKLLQLDEFDNGAKTGTSNRVIANPNFNDEISESDDNQKFLTVPGDSWTVGFTPHLITGVWVGNNRGEPMKSGATGLSVAAPVWKSFNDSAHELLAFDPAQEYESPVKLKTYKLNKFSGDVATEDTPESLIKSDVFASFALPKRNDNSVQEKEIDRVTGQIADPELEDYLKETMPVLVLQSIRSTVATWQNPVTDWLKEHPKFVTTLGEDTEEGWDAPAPETLIDTSSRQARTETLRDRIERLRRASSEGLGVPPKIQITSPNNAGILAPGKVEIKVSVVADAGVRAVEFYFDDQFVDESARAPYTGSFTLPSRYETDSIHTLKAIAVDMDYQSSVAEIEVIIGNDIRGPEIIFLAPTGNQEIPINSLYEIQLSVEDDASAIAAVEFLVDDQVVKSLTSAPFAAQVVADSTLGRRYIKVRARDVHLNTTEKSMPVTYVRETLVRAASAQIDRILSNRGALTVEMLFPEPTAIEAARVQVKKSGRTLHTSAVSRITKVSSISLLRAITQGNAQIELQVKNDDGEWEVVSTKTANF